MNFVEPIRSRKKLAQIKNLLRGQQRLRDLLLFVVGINLALHISDLLPLKISNFLDEDGKTKRRFWIRERKRGKRREVVINESIRQALQEYLAAYPGIVTDPERFVFFSTQNPTYVEPIKRGQAWKFISYICREVGVLAELLIRPLMRDNQWWPEGQISQKEPGMRRVKRTALRIKPKQRYIEWANALDEDGVKIGVDFMPEGRIYLVEDSTDFELDIEAMVKPHFETIFEEELNNWHRVESDWPSKRDLAMFGEWFEVEMHSMVLDLGQGRLKTERYERYQLRPHAARCR